MALNVHIDICLLRYIIPFPDKKNEICVWQAIGGGGHYGKGEKEKRKIIQNT